MIGREPVFSTWYGRRHQVVLTMLYVIYINQCISIFCIKLVWFCICLTPRRHKLGLILWRCYLKYKVLPHRDFGCSTTQISHLVTLHDTRADQLCRVIMSTVTALSTINCAGWIRTLGLLISRRDATNALYDPLTLLLWLRRWLKKKEKWNATHISTSSLL